MWWVFCAYLADGTVDWRSCAINDNKYHHSETYRISHLIVFDWLPTDVSFAVIGLMRCRSAHRSFDLESCLSIEMIGTESNKSLMSWWTLTYWQQRNMMQSSASVGLKLMLIYPCGGYSFLSNVDIYMSQIQWRISWTAFGLSDLWTVNSSVLVLWEMVIF